MQVPSPQTPITLYLPCFIFSILFSHLIHHVYYRFILFIVGLLK